MKFFKSVFSVLLISFAIVGCSNSNTQSVEEKEKVSFLLDWTPNTNHTGIYVGIEKGFYDEVGIELEVLNPPENSTLALIAAGKADFGVSFQDTMGIVMSENEDFPIVAVASIIQHNTSGLISLKEKGIDSFKELENKTYATWGDPLEQAIIKQVVENEGGDFEKVNLYYSTVTDAVSAIQANVDTVWVYEAWDVMSTTTAGIDYNFIKFKDVEESLDFYTPVIVTSTQYLNENEDLTKRFLEATKKGYEYAIENPQESAEILYKYAPEYDLEMLIMSQEYLANEYKADVDRWGYIDPVRWNRFFKWVYEEGLIETDLENIGFTNDYLPQ